MLLLESCLQTSMTYTIAECRVNKLLMMDRKTVRNMIEFHVHNKFVKLVHLVGFIIKKFVTMNGHMNVKLRNTLLCSDVLQFWMLIFRSIMSARFPHKGKKASERQVLEEITSVRKHPISLHSCSVFF